MLRSIGSINNDMNTIIISENPYSQKKLSYRELFIKHRGSIIRLLGKIFYYFLHLLLISLFETLFYFYYISKEEDQAILNNLMNLIDSLTGKCNLLPVEYRIDIINVLSKINNTEYLFAFKERMEDNHNLFNYSMLYIYSFVVIVIVLGVFVAYYNENRLKIKTMIFDTVIMIFILGIFEYNFFINIVKKYTPITKGELEYSIEKQLIRNCS